jgi:hypothetical protein
VYSVIVASLTRTAAVWVVVREVAWRSKRMCRSKIVRTLPLLARPNESLVMLSMYVQCPLHVVSRIRHSVYLRTCYLASNPLLFSFLSTHHYLSYVLALTIFYFSLIRTYGLTIFRFLLSCTCYMRLSSLTFYMYYLL